MIVLYLLVGVIAAIISALPLGAANVSVIQTTIKKGEPEALKICYGGGFGEILLALFALNFNIMIADFFERNLWLQITFTILFFVAGVFFLLKKPKTQTHNKHWFDLGQSKFLKGFVLSILNPPVLLYWLVAFSLINQHLIMLTTKSSYLDLGLFFLGVYIGKVLTLYGYSKWSKHLKGDTVTVKKKVSRVIGLVFIGIGIFQTIKLIINA